MERIPMISEETFAMNHSKRIDLNRRDPAELSAMPWREYLAEANFNQDPDQMCRECKIQQEIEHKRIICKGYSTYKERLKDQYGDVLDELEKHLDKDEIDALNAEFDPVTWFRLNMKDPSKVQTRFYQEMILRCTAKNISLRCGRRTGKTFSIALKVLHKIATAPEPIEVLVVAPQITMIDEIVQTLEELTDNLTIDGFITSKKNQPILLMKFFNGSLLKGITAGTDGKSARGKRADIIWIDEVDFVSSKAMEAIKGVQLDNPNVEMYYTSTPIGQGNLYNFANLPITKEFHYPTFANPFYTDAMHETLGDMTDVAYVQECLAGYTQVRTLNEHGKISTKQIKDLVKGDTVWFDQRNPVPVIQDARCTGRKAIYRYKTHLGYVDCTDDHSFPSRLGRKTPIKDLKELPFYPQSYPQGYEYSEARILGHAASKPTDMPLLFRCVEDAQAYTDDLYTVFRIKPEILPNQVLKYKGQTVYTHMIKWPEELLEALSTLEEDIKRYDQELLHEFFLAYVSYTCFKPSRPARGSATTFPLMPVEFTVPDQESADDLQWLIDRTVFKDSYSFMGELGSKYSLRLTIKGEHFIEAGGFRYNRKLELDLMAARGHVMHLRSGDDRWTTVSEFRNEFIHGGALFMPIIDVEYLGITDVYNLGVGSKDTTYLLANGIKTYNCLALFGVDEAGVFPVSKIDKSLESYEVDVFSQRERYTIFIGVDWNHDNNGTRIVVVAYDKYLQKFFIAEKAKIAKLQMTQALAVDYVVEMNRKYHADHILCDEGFGTAQISQLRLRGESQYGKVPLDHPDLRLVDTVAVNFGSTLTITDPVTHQPLKRNTKQYIVENTQKLLEDDKLRFCAADDELMQQMKNYHIQSRGIRGNVYKPKNKKIGDHDLDAYMLALYGFEMFYSGFIKPQAVEHVGVLSATTPKYEAVSFKVRGVRKAKSRRLW